jgi:rSAM/selenodomain-associated transferase 2
VDLCKAEEKGKQTSSPSIVSVIIPALNEADRIGRTLEMVAAEPGVEIIVVDGGSRDATREIARSYGVRVVKSLPGRARQMNAGAAQATGAFLIFLHADTHLPPGFAHAVRSALVDRSVPGGAFRFRLDDKGWALRLIEWGTNIRSRWFSLPFGDQAIFLRAETFREIGRYPDWPIMEDVGLARQLKRRGRLRLLNLKAETSARRWRRLGPWRTTWLHIIALLAYFGGVTPARINDWLARLGYNEPLGSAESGHLRQCKTIPAAQKRIGKLSLK